MTKWTSSLQLFFEHEGHLFMTLDSHKLSEIQLAAAEGACLYCSET